MEKTNPQSRYYSKNKEKYKKWALDAYRRDPEKAKARHKAWVEKNKEYVKTYQRESKRKRKELAIEYLGGVCKRCNQTYHPACFEFHHIDPKDKDRDPSKMLQLSWKRLTAELDKCQLLCANCHRLTHHEGYNWSENTLKPTLQKTSSITNTPTEITILGEPVVNEL